MLTVEHRGAPAPEPIARALAADGDDVHLEMTSAERDEQVDGGPLRDAAGLDRAILHALAHATEALPRADLRARLRVRNERLGEALARLVADGVVLRQGDRFRVPDSPQP